MIRNAVESSRPGIRSPVEIRGERIHALRGRNNATWLPVRYDLGRDACRRSTGVSDMHTVMAAGFAGGIGLCGGACGALGAALWIIGMNIRKERDVDNLWKDDVFNSKIDDLIDRFLKSTDFEFECSEIVGRRFENIGDHAGYLRDGGCSKIIEVLATK